MGGDLEEALVETLQSTTDFLVAQVKAIRLQQVTSSCQCLADAGKTGTRHAFGKCECGDVMRMCCILSSPVEFAL